MDLRSLSPACTATISGDIPIEAGGSMVGAIGVSGAPDGDNDDTGAKAGIAAIASDLNF